MIYLVLLLCAAATVSSLISAIILLPHGSFRGRSAHARVTWACFADFIAPIVLMLTLLVAWIATVVMSIVYSRRLCA